MQTDRLQNDRMQANALKLIIRVEWKDSTGKSLERSAFLVWIPKFGIDTFLRIQHRLNELESQS